MLHNRHGQAKILTDAEITRLLTVGLRNARDQAFFAVCLYTAGRLSEVRQLPHTQLFQGDAIASELVFPKAITKGRQATRVIPVHPSLAAFLQAYRRSSLALVAYQQAHGHWSHYRLSGDTDAVLSTLVCPHCQHTHLFRSGRQGQHQIYRCKACGRYCRDATVGYRDPLDRSAAALPAYGVTGSVNFGLLFSQPENPFLFPGKGGHGCLSQSAASAIFAQGFARAGIVGAASHSCRRTCLTRLHQAGVPLRVIQEISGHRDLGALQRYLEV